MGIDLKNWMQNLPDGSDLLALNLCGTHDCVTQHIRLPHFFCCIGLSNAKVFDRRSEDFLCCHHSTSILCIFFMIH